MTIQQTISPDPLCISRFTPFYGCHIGDGLFTFGDVVKKCSRCAQTKRLDEFNKNKTNKDGRTGWCIACRALYRQSMRDSLLKYGRAYYQDNKKKLLKYSKEYNKNNPHKKIAHNKIRGALQAGKLLRPARCEACNTACKPQAHHHAGYLNPLDIVWLCIPCHAGIHRTNKTF